MKGDFSRNSFDPKKHYSSLRMQQGRVQMDADWNEQADIVDYRLTHVTNDFLGTVGPRPGAGFGITSITGSNNFNISAGRYYVNGLLAENNQQITFITQPDYPIDSSKIPAYDSNITNNIYMAYLEIWRRNISTADDPSIAEVALGGPDTCVRTQNLAQVKLFHAAWDGLLALTYEALFDSKSNNPVVVTNVQNWNAIVNRIGVKNPALGQLLPDLKQPTLQNQLYRIEIHQGGNLSNSTFKWSRDNASISSKIQVIQTSNDNKTAEITIPPMPQNEQMGFAVNQWIELITPSRELTGVPGDMAKITKITNTINGTVLEVTASNVIGTDLTTNNNVMARLWSSDSNNTSGIYPVNALTTLEGGLSVSFPTPSNDFRTGDYWLIPARAADNSILWPRDPSNNNSFAKQIPQGIQRFYAPLAIMKRLTNTWEVDQDCRHINILSVLCGDPNAPDCAIYVDKDGDVGIGAKNPQSRLDVEGGGLIVNGGAADLKTGLVVSGTVPGNANTAIINGPTQINSTLSVEQDANLKKNVIVGTPGVPTDKLTVNGNTEIINDLTVQEDTILNKGLTVSGTISGSTNTTIINGSTQILGASGTLSVDQDANLKKNVIIGTPGVPTDKLTVNGNTEIINDLTVQEDTVLNKGLTVSGTITSSNQTAIINGPTWISNGSNLYVDNQIRLHENKTRGTTVPPFYACSAQEDLRIIRGSIAAYGQTPNIRAGTNFSLQVINIGVFQINFTVPFTTLPTAVVTQLFNNSTGYPWPTDNAVIVNITNNNMIILTGNSDVRPVNFDDSFTGARQGFAENRDFEFIVMGPI